MSHSHLAAVLISVIRKAHADRQAERELIRAAIELLSEKDRENDRLRASYVHLLIQHRALVSGKTAAEERSELEEGAAVADAIAQNRRDAA